MPTCLVLEIPPGFEGQGPPGAVSPLRTDWTLANPSGTLDSDYRGEVPVILIHLCAAPMTLAPSDRIAQLVVTRLGRIEWEEAEDFGASHRGEGGLGSRGLG